MNFEKSFERLVGHEGGYVCHKDDPGGETCFGVSKRTYPNEDIKGMTLDRARSIYRHDFWIPAGCDSVPDGIKFDLFDMAVNSGVSRAIKTLQKAVGAVEDGQLGPRTLQALQTTPAPRVVARFNGARLTFMASLPQWPTFSRGWAARIASNLMEA